MPVYIGIDCGGTSTRAVIASAQGDVLGIGKGGGGNPNASGTDGATASIRDAVTAGLRQARLAETDIATVFVGMAGVVGEDDTRLGRSIIQAAVPTLAPAALGLDHDIRIALAGGLTGDEGVALIVGTGSSSYGRTADGRTWQSGGWGSVLDDGGSAHGLGLAAMRAACRIADGRLPKSRLLPDLMAALKLTEIRQIIDRVYRAGMTKAEVGALAPVVIAAWAAGDKVAKDIVDDEVYELEWIVRTTAGSLNLNAPRVCYSGGLIENSAEYAAAVRHEIETSLPGAKVAPAKLSPVLGAVLLAYEQAHIEHNAATWDRLATTLAKLDR